MTRKAPGIEGFTAGIYIRTFKIFPKLVTATYNQCLKRGYFPQN